MNSKPTVFWTLHDGSTISLADSLNRRFNRLLAQRGRRARHHMRVGRHAVTTLDDGTAVVARMYSGLCDDGSIRPGSRFWSDHVADRTRQLDLITACVAGHPLERGVLADVTEERAHLAEGERILAEIAAEDAAEEALLRDVDR